MPGLVAVAERSSIRCRWISPPRRRITGFDIPELERHDRTKLDSDVCLIDRKDIYVRGCLEIPIVGHDDHFTWGVWVSVSKESFTTHS